MPCGIPCWQHCSLMLPLPELSSLPYQLLCQTFYFKWKTGINLCRRSPKLSALIQTLRRLSWSSSPSWLRKRRAMEELKFWQVDRPKCGRLSLILSPCVRIMKSSLRKPVAQSLICCLRIFRRQASPVSILEKKTLHSY